MTVAASLSITANAAGFIARTKVIGARPVVRIGAITHEFSWLTTHRYVMQPGVQTITVYFKRRASTVGHASVEVTVLPGETIHLAATLRGRGSFTLDVRRDRIDPRTMDRPV